MDNSVQGPITFDIQTPKSADDLRANVSYALALGLPELDVGGKRLCVVANGPSAVDFDFEIAADVLALNGALKLFTDRGLAPTYWAACDPQALVARFLLAAPLETTYLVASKCAPAVFSRLSNHDVRLWHVNDVELPTLRQVPCAVSVTLSVLLLAHRLGYRELDVWGWDCCFAPDGSHHASTGDLNRTSTKVEIDVGGETFFSTPTWACEAEDAVGVLRVLRWCGSNINIHGRSMVPAVIAALAAREARHGEVA